MERTICYPVSERDAGVRISTFLRRKGFSRQNLIELKKYEGSLLAGGRMRHFNERTSAGDLGTLFYPEGVHI